MRTRFSKNITYAANWDSYSTFAPLPQYAVEFWDALDYIGVDAYFPLTDSYDPPVEQLLGAWSHAASGWWGTGRNWTNELHSTYTQTGKEIIFTEIGYCSQNGTNTQPWNWNISPTLDLQEQADCYQAALEVFKDKAWFTGWFWWNWETDPNAGGPTDRHYTPQNKPAQDVLNQYYYEVHDVAVTSVTAWPTRASPGELISINVTTEDQGDYTETFNVSLYYTRTADPLIGTQTVTDLLPGENRTLTFEWTPNTTGRYEIRANTTEILGDIDPADNTNETTIYVYDGGSPNGESVNGFHIAVFISGLFAAVIIIPKIQKNNKRSLVNIPANIIKHNLPNNPKVTRHDWIRRQSI